MHRVKSFDLWRFLILQEPGVEAWLKALELENSCRLEIPELEMLSTSRWAYIYIIYYILL